ncbi:MAG TPA: hypothetical protein VF148_07580 [Acidimicrobiia bacterium]
MRGRLITLFAIAALAATALPASATPALKWAQETTKAACNGVGAPVVNVTQHVTGDIDSGFSGGWAVDTYTRRIKVWEKPNGDYCAVVRYAGTFDPIPHANSPGEDSTGILDGDEEGSMVGGYRAAISGGLLADSVWPTRGTVGQYDYECSSLGDCPGAVDWVGQYFESDYDFDYEFWGWVYRAGRHGIWVNASTGSSGDIG